MTKHPPFNRVDREELLSQKVETQIKDAIIKKVFLAGDKLPGELELTKTFGVSRTAVREALRMLAARGLLEIRKGSGAYVSDFSVSNIVDPFSQFLELKCGKASHLYLIQIRRMIEPEIARIAASRFAEKEFTFLRENLAQMQETYQHPEEMMQIDIKFHRKLADSVGNPLISVVLEPIFQLLPKFISSTYSQERAPDLAIEFHEKILQAIAHHDEEAAYTAMKKHLEKAEEHVLQYYKTIGFADY
ncbi:FadR family transcriptional regulator [candidate division KSB1 bacterium]|nr:FadR family transcriptional regulator [candidate division KSB1 bacterium]